MAKVTKKKGKGGKALKVDFSGVEKEVRKRGKRIPEGDYLCKIVTAEKRKKEGSSSYYLSWKFQIIENAQGGKKQAGIPLYYITSLKPDALFNLRNLIYSATDGKTNVAGKVVTLNPSKYYGKKIGVTVEDEEYDNKVRSKAVDVMPPSQLEAEEEDEEDEDETEEEEDEDEGDEEEDDDEDEDEEDEDEEDDEDDLDDVDDDDL